MNVPRERLRSVRNRLLIDRAGRLLQSGANSVKEVASILQLESVSLFSSLYEAGGATTLCGALIFHYIVLLSYTFCSTAKW